MAVTGVRKSIVDRWEWDALAILHGIVGIGAVGGGLALMTGTSGMPERYLESTSFDSFLIPGLALATLVGGSSLLAAAAIWRRRSRALELSFLASAILAGWFIVQIAEIGLISWLQPAFIGALMAQVALAVHVRSNRH